VAAAWLTRRTGLDTWTLLPTGGDPVTVTTALEGPTTPEGSNWRDLWLSGGATVLGTFTPLF